jgi:hypothetical protein
MCRETSEVSSRFLLHGLARGQQDLRVVCVNWLGQKVGAETTLFSRGIRVQASSRTDEGKCPNSHRSTQQARGHGSGCLSTPSRSCFMGLDVAPHALSLHTLPYASAHPAHSLTFTHSLTHHSPHSPGFVRSLGFRPIRAHLVGRFRCMLTTDTSPQDLFSRVPLARNVAHTYWISCHPYPPSTARRVGWCAAASPASCRRLHDAAQAHGSHRFATPSQNGSRMAQARPAADPGRRSADTRGRRPR